MAKQEDGYRVPAASRCHSIATCIRDNNGNRRKGKPLSQRQGRRDRAAHAGWLVQGCGGAGAGVQAQMQKRIRLEAQGGRCKSVADAGSQVQETGAQH